MGRRDSKKDPKRYESDASTLSSNPFAALAGVEVDAASEQPAPEPAPAPAEPLASATALTSTANPLDAAHLVVRKERKGHGGKTVTVIEGWECSDEALDVLMRRLRKTFGCSGRVDAQRVLLSGARQSELAAWLREAGARRVTVGN